MFRRLLTLAIILFAAAAFRPADPAITAVIQTDAKQMTTDQLGGIYLWQHDALQKFDVHGKLIRTYSDKTFGTISHVDATNPLRVLVFNRDFARIVFLDNTLSPNGESVKLDALGFANASLAAASHDNGIWIYDPLNYELIRFDRNLVIERRTGNLAQLIGEELQPDFLIQQENYVILNDPKRGVFLFDLFGTYLKKLPLLGLAHMQLRDDALIYFQAPSIHRYQLQTFEASVYEWPTDSLLLDARIEPAGVVALRAGRVEVYARK